MIAGVRAKVTDFVMSELTSMNPCMTAMTLCPGNLQYMSPEDLEEPPLYTHKLDILVGSTASPDHDQAVHRPRASLPSF